MSFKLLIFFGVKDGDDELEVGDSVEEIMELILGSLEVMKLTCLFEVHQEELFSS